jgi:hypothetical protein
VSHGTGLRSNGLPKANPAGETKKIFLLPIAGLAPRLGAGPFPVRHATAAL